MEPLRMIDPFASTRVAGEDPGTARDEGQIELQLGLCQLCCRDLELGSHEFPVLFTVLPPAWAAHAPSFHSITNRSTQTFEPGWNNAGL